MIDIDEILPFAVAIIIAIILFWGVIATIQKSLKPTSEQNTIDSKAQIKEQKQLITDVRQRQKQLLRDQKQKIRDLRRR